MFDKIPALPEGFLIFTTPYPVLFLPSSLSSPISSSIPHALLSHLHVRDTSLAHNLDSDLFNRRPK